MTIEIKTATLEPVRNTFAHIERRFGDKPATRYQEATYDVQSEVNFHYRPLWQPELELTDTRRTAIKMADWYAFRDPRQFYYGAYVQARAKMQEVAENNYAFFEKRGLAERMPEEAKQKVIRCLLPLRHVEHAANLNNMYGSAYGNGTAITQALLFDGMDRLGIAQYVSRIGLLLDGNTGDALSEARSYWMSDPLWQGVRRYLEKTLVTEDWFEVFIAQDVVLDSLIYNLIYEQFDAKLAQQDGQDLGMLTEFMQVWFKDASRWVDAVLKTAAAESDENRLQLEQWISHWRGQAEEALSLVAHEAVEEGALQVAREALDKRLSKAGLFK
ncbi:aromatic/alkene monooxygenase hydroxylase subunit beta [Marinobacterium arenosum]|uniref:aromatic/alkene monooxygenase hydroxylase subunit beta n=1 Tax=Marinobacterium arenosum TaxID=2862496 RepID=UPI001C96F680|nr:aromatic/alkene monooxygenase hydroxylase subunit beta [Marinobacterium arenosum]MBY4676720.1 aromatic/alkene monooxygenase hydroxylase subunit beta [Marinobacterium arenosum]